MCPVLRAGACLPLLTWLCAGVAAAQPAIQTAGPRADGVTVKAAGSQALHVPDVPLPDPSREGPTSLQQILAYADRYAPTILVARARLGLGDAALAEAAPLLVDNPSLMVGVGPRFTGDGRFMQFNAALTQRVEIAGERGLRLSAAERTAARLRAELDEVRWEVHRDIHAAFHRALVARERVHAADRVRAFQERLVEITRGRLRAGDVSPLAVRLAEGELSQARVAYIATEQAYLRARLQLGAIGGWPVAHPPQPAGHLDVPRDPPMVDALLLAARRNQPRLRTLQAVRREAEAQARAADRDAWPEPTLGLQLSRQGLAAGLSETALVGTLSLPLPLFRRNQGARAEARARVQSARAEQVAFGSVLRNQIEQFRTSVLASADRVRTYGREILPTFEENLRLIQRAFELGEIDILQVSVARERFLRIQADALDAYGDYFVAIADLEGAIGADLWPDERHEPMQSIQTRRER